MTRVFAWLGMAVLAAFVVFSAGGAPGTLSADRRIVAVLGAAVLLAVWGLLWRRDGAWRPRSVIAPVIAIGLGSLAISTAFSRYPRVSVEYLAYAVVLAALYLLLVQLMARPFFRTRLIALSAMMFFIIAAAYVVLVVAHWIPWWDAVGGLTVPPLRPEFEGLTFGNPSHVLVIGALLGVPLAANTSWETRGGLARLIGVVVVTGVVALLTGSRAGWLALALAGAAGLGILLAVGRQRLSKVARKAPAMSTLPGRIAAVGAAGLIFAAVAVFAPAVLRRATEGGEGLRISYVVDAMRMFVDAPITGTGLGTWVVQRIAYTEPPEIDYYIPHAHNVYAQTVAEQGLVGVVAGLFVVVGIAWLIREAFRSGGIRRQWGIATLIALAYFAAHQILDFHVNLPAVFVGLALPIAYLDATAETSLPFVGGIGRSAWRANLIHAALAIAAVLAVVGLLWQEIPGRELDEAVIAANEGDWASAREPALAAAAADPAITSYSFTAGLVEAQLGNHASAAGYFRRVAENDDLPEAWLNLAAEEEASGNRDGVGPALARALRLGYQRPAIAMAAGELALRTGDDDTALRAFTAAVTTVPSLLADPWWQADAGRAAIYPRVIQLSIEAAPDREWEFALMSGDRARAERTAPTPTSLLFAQAWSGDAAARDEIVADCRAQPTDLGLQLLCARVEGRAGKVDAANQFRYIADVQLGLSYSAGAEMRVATKPLVGRTLEGNPAIFWGSYTYRRPTPWDVLVPSLPHLTLE